MTLAQLAGLLGGELTDPSRSAVTVSSVNSLGSAGPGDLAFLWASKYEAEASTSGAEAIVCREPIDGKTCILVDEPDRAMLTLSGEVYRARHPALEPGIHPSAIVSPEADLGEQVAVGAGAVIESGAVIGCCTQIRARAYVGSHVTTGENCVIHPNATVLDHCRLGDRVVIWSGAVIGKDGFGFLQRDGKHVRVPQIGTVIIEDDVEIGALTTVARGAIDNTIVRRGAIVDDHVHIAHGCDIGEYAVLLGTVGMGGSVGIGARAFLLANARISAGLEVGEGAIVGTGTKVMFDDVPAGEVYLAPAGTHPEAVAKRIEAMLPRLPEMRRRLRQLEKEVAELKKSAD
jgi:UDP-3-O-[3-hydroxymyristoyl] glucosamine N-acyltransferase